MIETTGEGKFAVATPDGKSRKKKKKKIWKRKEWPIDRKKSLYVPIYKKGDKMECGNYRTIALISHAI